MANTPLPASKLSIHVLGSTTESIDIMWNPAHRSNTHYRLSDQDFASVHAVIRLQASNASGDVIDTHDFRIPSDRVDFFAFNADLWCRQAATVANLADGDYKDLIDIGKALQVIGVSNSAHPRETWWQDVIQEAYDFAHAEIGPDPTIVVKTFAAYMRRAAAGVRAAVRVL